MHASQNGQAPRRSAFSIGAETHILKGLGCTEYRVSSSDPDLCYYLFFSSSFNLFNLTWF